MFLLYYFCVLCVHYPLLGVEYIYPVASYNDKIILYVEQTSSQNIQLFQWDISTHHTQPLLWSLFNPAEIKLLPNNKGFSFFDNGRLRLKLFQKRSPKAIDFDEPLFNFNGLDWIDENTGYCSAQYNNNFSIFQIHDNGRVDYLISCDTHDYMYPQKVNNQLFYISRENKIKESEVHYKIMQSKYGNNMPSEEIINFYDQTIIFLNMLSESEGFVLQYNENRDNNPDIFHFFYYHLMKQSDHTWKNECLFAFSLPTYVCGEKNDKRLFESILPLLPRIIDYKIYFSDYLPEIDMLDLYYYDLVTNQKNKICLHKKPGHIFAPIKCGDTIYCGGAKDNNDIAYKNPLFTVF